MYVFKEAERKACIYLLFADVNLLIYQLTLFLFPLDSRHHLIGLPGGAGGKEPTCQCRSCKRHKVWSLHQEDPLEKGMATHSSILA